MKNIIGLISIITAGAGLALNIFTGLAMYPIIIAAVAIVIGIVGFKKDETKLLAIFGIILAIVTVIWSFTPLHFFNISGGQINQ